MVHCPESDSILFVSSPFLNGLEGLTGRGLFISDIPLHDATRDVILVGEQARAQVKSHLQFSIVFIVIKFVSAILFCIILNYTLDILKASTR